MKKRYFEYDLIRAAAMLLIVFYHMNMEWSTRSLGGIFAISKIGASGYLGWIGVSLFILISGAAQCISYEKCPNLKIYYKKRWLGIFPTFYLAYFLCFLVGRLAATERLLTPSFIYTLIGMDGYLTIFGVETQYLVGEWFLGMILILYLLFPLFYRLVERYPVKLLVFISLYYIIMLQIYPEKARIEKDALLNAPVFIAGIYLYRYGKQISLRAGAASLAIFLLMIQFSYPDFLTPYLFLTEGLALYVFLMSVGGFLSERKEAVAVWFRKVISVIAQYAYEIFLVHHVLISVSLNAYPVGADLGSRGYLLWAVRILLIIGGAAWLISPGRRKKRG